jgi:hypothetical protein
MNLDTSKQGGSWLSKASDEYEHLMFQLDISLGGKYEIHDLDVWRIENEDREAIFEQEHQHKDRLFAWKNAKELNPLVLQNLSRDGFKFGPQNVMRFTVGNIDASSIKSLRDKGDISRFDHHFIYSEIVPGQALVTDDPQRIDYSKTSPFYSSWWVSPIPLDANNDGEFSLKEYTNVASFAGRPCTEYSHQYILRDESSVLPRYVLKASLTEISTTTNENEKPSQSDITRAAGAFIDPATLTIVDKDDTKNIHHGMMPAGQVFDQAMYDLSKNDILTEKKKENLDDLLIAMDSKVREVNLHYAKGYEKIKQATAKAINELQNKTRKKLEEILSVEIELRRQQEHLGWVEAYIKRRLHKANPTIQDRTDILASRGINTGKTYKGTTASPEILNFMRLYKSYLSYRNTNTRAKPTQTANTMSSIESEVIVQPEIKVFSSKNESDAYNQSKLASPTSNKNRMSILQRSNQRSKSFWSSGVSSVNVDAVGMGSAMENFIRKATDGHVYETSVRLEHDDVSAATRTQLDRVMANITKTIDDTMNSKGLPLPLSVLRMSSLGDQYRLNIAGEASVVHRGVLNAQNSRLTFLSSQNEDNRMQMRTAMNSNQKGKGKYDTNGMYGPREGRAVGGAVIGENIKPSIDQARSKALSAGHGTNHQGGMRGATGTPSMVGVGVGNSRSGSAMSGLFGDGVKVVASTNTNTIQSKIDKKGMASLFAMSNNDPNMTKPSESHSQSAPQNVASSPQSAKNIGNDLHDVPNQVPGWLEQPKTPYIHSTNKLHSPHSANTVAPAIANARSVQTKSLAQQETQSPVKSGRRSSMVMTSVSSMLPVAKRYAKAYGLTSIQEKRGKQLRSRLGDMESDLVFPGTELLTELEANKLYFCLPFMANPPLPKMVFSTRMGSKRTLDTLFAACAKVPKPVVIIITSGEYTFGAYLSTPLVLTGLWAGSPASFLFSSTLDIKIPYHGERVPNIDKPDPSHCYGFYADIDQLVIGNGDLVIDQNLMNGSSELEGCYGVGMGAASHDAKHFLAGAQGFEIDDLEVWTIL